MLAADLIRTVEQAGGHLEPDGNGLVVEAPKPLPEPIMTELRAHKAEVIDFLNRPVARVVLLAVPPGVPEAWVQGVADLLAMAQPASCPGAKWQTLREDAYRFLRDWAAQARELDWTALDQFGVHPEKPWVRFDCMGLVPLLNGAKVVALSNTGAVIEKPSGARLTFRRRADVPNEACLIWDIGRKRTCLAVARQQH